MPNEAMGSIEHDGAIIGGQFPPEARLEAVDAYPKKMSASGFLTVLPTSGNPPTVELFNETQQAFTKHHQIFVDISRRPDESGPVQAAVLQLVNHTAFVIEVSGEMADAVRETQVGPKGDLQGVDAHQFNDGLEPPNADIKASIAVSGPFLHFPPFGVCGEKSFPLSVECWGCGIVIKEFRGLQLRLVLRLVRKVIQPWFTRRRSINTWVWVLEWVPVQVIKTITVKCGCDDGGTKVTKTTVLDRELSNFWRCL